MSKHFVALDWAQEKMAIARITEKSDTVRVLEGPTDLMGLKEYLSNLKGEIILTFEESTGAQWLYTELKPLVRKLVVCDPYRNKLLSEGAKNDKIDATKLVRLLRAGMLKEVYHSGNEFIYIRELTSAYGDLIKCGVRLKNQRSALFRAKGQDYKKDDLRADHTVEAFVIKRLDDQIANYEAQKKEYEEEFKRLSKKHPQIRLLKSLPGIANIHAVQIIATIVDAKRFKSAGHFLSYCGLIKHEKMSGGRSYGRRSSRHSRHLKGIFKMASFSVTLETSNNPMKELYDYLVSEKKKPEHIARHAVARRIAVLSYGILKSGKKYEPYRWRNKEDVRQLSAS